MKKVITAAMIAFLGLCTSVPLQAKSASTSHVKVEEKLPSELTARVRKTQEYQGSGSKRKKVEVISATVKVPFAKVGRRGKGNIEMIVKEIGKKKKIAKVSNLKKGSKIHANMNAFLCKAIEDFKTQAAR